MQLELYGQRKVWEVAAHPLFVPLLRWCLEQTLFGTGPKDPQGLLRLLEERTVCPTLLGFLSTHSWAALACCRRLWAVLEPLLQAKRAQRCRVIPLSAWRFGFDQSDLPVLLYPALGSHLFFRQRRHWAAELLERLPAVVEWVDQETRARRQRSLAARLAAQARQRKDQQRAVQRTQRAARPPKLTNRKPAPVFRRHN
jgi:hypothetical protein